jgi:hypothetical protein
MVFYNPKHLDQPVFSLKLGCLKVNGERSLAWFCFSLFIFSAPYSIKYGSAKGLKYFFSIWIRVTISSALLKLRDLWARFEVCTL